MEEYITSVYLHNSYIPNALELWIPVILIIPLNFKESNSEMSTS